MSHDTKSRSFVSHFSELPDNRGSRWPDDDEVFGIRTPLSRPLGLRRIGVHHDRLKRGMRSSRPHAEAYEEECVFVLRGRAVCTVDGAECEAPPGFFAAFAPATGVEHSFRNDSDEDVELLVIGERRDHGCIATQALLSTWGGETLDAEAVFATDATYEIAEFGKATGPAGIAALLQRRTEHYGADGYELMKQAVGFDEGFFEWRSATHRGVCVMSLTIKHERFVSGATEYVSAR